jgi:hypothetical protein
MTTRVEAEALWSDLREGFVNAERIVKEIIKERAWEPLGYTSFVEAWNDRMKGVRLATDALKAHVVYALFDSGLEAQGVYEALGVGSGVSPETVRVLGKKKALGIPADFATTRVRAHDRAKPGERRRIIVELRPDEVDYFDDLCKARGRDLREESAKAIRQHFRRMERSLRAVDA